MSIGIISANSRYGQDSRLEIISYINNFSFYTVIKERVFLGISYISKSPTRWHSSVIQPKGTNVIEFCALALRYRYSLATCRKESRQNLLDWSWKRAQDKTKFILLEMKLYTQVCTKSLIWRCTLILKFYLTFPPNQNVSTWVSCNSITIFRKGHTQDKLWLLLFLHGYEKYTLRTTHNPWILTLYILLV